MSDHNSFDGVTRRQLDHGYGLTAVKHLMCRHAAERHVERPDRLFAQHFGGAFGADHVLRKTAALVPADITATPAPLSAGFFRDAEAASIYGRLSSSRVSFFTPITAQIGPITGAWTGEGLPAAVVKPTLTEDAGLAPLKMSWITVIDRRLFELPTRPGAVEYLYELLAARHREALDRALMDATLDAVANVNPASLTYDASVVSGTGSGATDMLNHARALLSRYVAGLGAPLARAVVVMSASNAVALRSSSLDVFSDLGPSGGTYLGLPCLASDSVSGITILDQGAVVFADEGEGDLDLASSASVEMLDTGLQQSGVSGTGASVVSMWQNGLVGVKVERRINWTLTTTDRVATLPISYAPLGSPA